MSKESDLQEKVIELTRKNKRLGLANTRLHEALDGKTACIESLEGERDRLKVCIDYAARRAFYAGV